MMPWLIGEDRNTGALHVKDRRSGIKFLFGSHDHRDLITELLNYANRKFHSDITEITERKTMDDLETKCIMLRNDILELDKKVLELMDHACYQDEQQFVQQHAEMKANTMLAYRHLEDARMRLGKVMQQIQGGLSKFDKPAPA